MHWANIPQLIRPFTPQSTSPTKWKERDCWLRDSDPNSDREGLPSSRLSCKPFSGSPPASSRPSSLHKPTNKVTSWQELSQDSWPSIPLHEPKGKEATFWGLASYELSLLLLLFLYSCQTACGQPSQASGSLGQLGKERPFQTPVSSPVRLPPTHTHTHTQESELNWEISKLPSQNTLIEVLRD